MAMSATGDDHGPRAPATRIAALRRIFRQVLGAPDYDAYLEHCRTAGHPPRLTKPEFLRDFFERKGRTSRCC
jgi:uncharacterized short protein YbdD (DUF466 family)